MERTQILFGTQTGTTEELAEELQKELKEIGLEAPCENIFDVSVDLLKEVNRVFILISTWGDGDPPDDAEDFYAEFVALPDASLKGLEFSVLALGDSGYELFCECGKNFDKHLERLGGKRIANRVDCDVDYEEPFENWMKNVIEVLKPQLVIV